jgi:hypothetical protein
MSIEPLADAHEIRYNDYDDRAFWLGVREMLLLALRLVEDHKLHMPRSVPSKRRRGEQ